MIVIVTKLVEQQVVLNYYCAKHGMPLGCFELSKKCKYVIIGENTLLQTNTLKDLRIPDEDLLHYYIYDQFVNRVLVPAYAESINSIKELKQQTRKYQDHLNRVKSIFAIP